MAVRIENAPIPDWARKRLSALASRVLSSTGARCCFNRRFGTAHFYLGDDIEFGVYSEQVLRPDGAWGLPEADEIIRTILLGRVPKQTKLRWLEQKQRERDSVMRDDLHRQKEALRPDRERRMARRIDKIEMGSHYRGRAAVNGLKE